MNKKSLIIPSIILLTFPFVAFALPAQIAGIGDLIARITLFLWPIFIGFAVIMFLYSGFMFLTAQGDPSKTSAARGALLWGIIGVIVGILAFSIPFIIGNSLGTGL